MYVRGEGNPAPPGTLNAIFFETIRKFDKPDAILARVGERWQPISHRVLRDRVRRIALGLKSLGIGAGDRVVILSENRAEWAIADWACLTSGITAVPIYATLPAEQIPYLLNDSGAALVFASTMEQAQKVASCRRQTPGVRKVIAFDDFTHPHADMTFRDLEDAGTALDTPERATAYERDALNVRPDDLATIIYTSGTTGNPKGTMLTHNNFHSELAALENVIPVGSTELNLSFLPLSHVFQRVADYYLFARGVTTAYAESFDVVAPAMRELRPTVVCAVPRVYEKIYARVLDTVLAGSGLSKRIFFWARGVGERWSTEKLAGRPVPAGLALQYAMARALVFRKIKSRTGGRVKYFVSGGAPLAADLNLFFYAVGLLILEGYGLTETTAVISVNTPDQLRIGTVGRPIRGVEVKIDSDGEIVSRGPHIMQGYLNKPEATREAIDNEGWFHTGDIGVIEDGFIRITDRKKDLIVTAGGKKIAPQPIENLVKSNEYVTQAVMIGDRRKYPILLLVPNFDLLEKWAKGRNIIWSDRSQLLTMPTVHSKMEQEVRGTLLGLASFESPKKIALLGRDFSVETGELTPTLKVKRRVVETTYRDLIESLYAAADPATVGARGDG